ncbi:hypothetical protein OK016_01100 [Vibrio chagasii]|nr:hypothetical protein [Vibrio chagasii]
MPGQSTRLAHCHWCHRDVINNRCRFNSDTRKDYCCLYDPADVVGWSQARTKVNPIRAGRVSIKAFRSLVPTNVTEPLLSPLTVTLAQQVMIRKPAINGQRYCHQVISKTIDIIRVTSINTTTASFRVYQSSTQ